MLVCVSFLLEQTALVFIPMFLLPFILSLLIAINITHIIALATKRASFANLFLSDILKYDIIWNENGDVIDRLILEILTFKKLGKGVHSYFHTIANVWIN